MRDRYQALTNSRLGAVTSRVGLPTPPVLERHEPGKPVVEGTVVLGGAHGGRLEEPVAEVLRSVEAHVVGQGDVGGGASPAALLFDASGIDEPGRLRALYEFFHPVIRTLRRNGRVIVVSGVPAEAPSPEAQIAQRAIEGFTRSVAKEIGAKGSTAQLVRVAEGGEGALASTLRFFLSAKSAYVDGQAIEVRPVDFGDVVVPGDWESPLAGRVAAVTGAARGIGESIAEILGRDGVCIRAGHHCAQPLMRKLGVPATARASFYVYNTPDEVDLLIDALDKAKGWFV